MSREQALARVAWIRFPLWAILPLTLALSGGYAGADEKGAKKPQPFHRAAAAERQSKKESAIREMFGFPETFLPEAGSAELCQAVSDIVFSGGQVADVVANYGHATDMGTILDDIVRETQGMPGNFRPGASPEELWKAAAIAQNVFDGPPGPDDWSKLSDVMDGKTSKEDFFINVLGYNVNTQTVEISGGSGGGNNGNGSSGGTGGTGAGGTGGADTGGSSAGGGATRPNVETGAAGGGGTGQSDAGGVGGAGSVGGTGNGEAGGAGTGNTGGSSGNETGGTSRGTDDLGGTNGGGTGTNGGTGDDCGTLHIDENGRHTYTACMSDGPYDPVGNGTGGGSSSGNDGTGGTDNSGSDTTAGGSNDDADTGTDTGGGSVDDAVDTDAGDEMPNPDETPRHRASPEQMAAIMQNMAEERRNRLTNPGPDGANSGGRRGNYDTILPFDYIKGRVDPYAQPNPDDGSQHDGNPVLPDIKGRLTQPIPDGSGTGVPGGRVGADVGALGRDKGRGGGIGPVANGQTPVGAEQSEGAMAAIGDVPAGQAVASEAAEGAAMVLSVSGSAERMMMSGGKPQWVPLRVGDQLGTCSIIRTGLRSGVQLQMPDGGQADVGSAAKFGLRDVGSARTAAQMTLKYGAVGVLRGRSETASGPSVETPAGVVRLASRKGRVAFSSGTGLRLSGGRNVWQAAPFAARNNVIAATGAKRHGVLATTGKTSRATIPIKPTAQTTGGPVRISRTSTARVASLGGAIPMAPGRVPVVAK